MSLININDPFTSAEIQYNLNTMKETLNRGKIVDPVFLDIFNAAITNLAAEQERAQLTKELTIVGKSMNASFNKKFDRVHKGLLPQESAGVHRPKVGEQFALTLIANEYQPGPQKDALTTLSADFDCRRIQGDGHCQFRAVGSGFLLSCQSLTPEQKREKIAIVNQSVEDLVGDDPQHPLNTLKGQLFEAISNINPQNADELVRDVALSQSIVKFLRILSSEENRQHPTETLLEMLETEGANLHDYCNGMSRMELAWEGGDPELSAIFLCLDIKIAVFDITVYTEVNQYPVKVYNEASEGPAIPLLYRPRHYDLLIQKN